MSWLKQMLHLFLSEVTGMRQMYKNKIEFKAKDYAASQEIYKHHTFGVSSWKNDIHTIWFLCRDGRTITTGCLRPFSKVG